MENIEIGDIEPEWTMDGVDDVDRAVSYLDINKKYCAEYNEIIVKEEALCKCGIKLEKHEDANSNSVLNKDGIKLASVPTDAYGDVNFKGATRRAKAKVCFR